MKRCASEVVPGDVELRTPDRGETPSRSGVRVGVLPACAVDVAGSCPGAAGAELDAERVQRGDGVAQDGDRQRVPGVGLEAADRLPVADPASVPGLDVTLPAITGFEWPIADRYLPSKSIAGWALHPRWRSR